MSEISIEQFTEALKQLGRQINNAGVNARLARKCKEIIYRRVKNGKGVTSYKSDPENTEQATLAPLSKSYIDYRKGLAIFFTTPLGNVVRISGTKKVVSYVTRGRGRRAVTARQTRKVRTGNITAPTLGEFGRPEKSNLTLTGQMLNDIVLSASDTGFQLRIGDKRRKGSNLTNAEVADYVQKGGSYTNGNGKRVVIPARPFFALTAGEIRILTRELENIIKERIQAISALR